MKFDVEGAKKAGYSDQEIQSFLKQKPPEKSFDSGAAKKAGYSQEEIDAFLNKKKQEPLTLGGSAKAYGSGFAGGAGGLVPDVVRATKPLAEIPGAPGGELASSANQLVNLLGLKGTHEITNQMAGQESQNALERILQQSGQFGGQEALVGTGIGGPVGGALGAAHGSASGAFYGGLRELGVGDEWALFATMLATLSPIAAQKWVGRVKSGTPVKDAVQGMYEERAALPPGTPPPSPPGATDLTKKVIGENLPVSKFETAEKALQEIGATPKEIPESRGALGVEVQIAPTESAKDLKGIVERPEGPGASISPVEFESEAAGGRALNTTIRENAAEARKEVTEAYKAAEQNYEKINSVADQQLIDELRAEADKIRQSAKPNTAEASVLKTIDEITDYYLTRNGMPVGQLIRTSDSISGMSNYELPFTGPKDILKKTAKTLDQAAIRAIENNGGNPKLLIEANQKYGRWANRFSNDDISPFLEKTVNNPESLFRKAASDEGAFRAVESASQGAPRSKEFTDAVARKIAEQKLGKFKSEQIGSPEYQETLRNLKALIGEKRASLYDQARRKELRIPRPSGVKTSGTGKLADRVTSVPKSTKVAEKISKYRGTTPEQLLSKLNSRSGIKELKKDLSPSSFDTLVKQKARSILQEGNIEHKFTGEQLYKILNKEENFEIFTEILGEEGAKTLKDAAKALGKEEMTTSRVMNFLKTVAKEGSKAAIGVKAFKILTSLLL